MREKFHNKYRIPSARLQNWDYGSNAAYFVTICTADRQHFFGNIVKTPNLGMHHVVDTPNLGVSGNNDIDRRNVETPKLGVSTTTTPSSNKIMDTCITIKNQLSEIGKIAQKYWLEIPQHFPFVELYEFIVMPNHVHGIIVINKTNNDIDRCNVEMPNLGVSGNNELDVSGRRNVETPKLGVSTTTTTPSTTTTSAPTPTPTAPTVPTTTENQNPGGKNDKWKPATLGVIINQYKRIVCINARRIHADFAWQSRFHDHIIRNDESFQNIRNYICENPAKWTEDKFYNKI